MVVLGIDTSTAIASVGVASSERGTTERFEQTGRHARTLLPLIDDVLGESGHRLGDLNRIAVSIGPGSFTGLRIGLSIAKGLGMATGVVVVGVPTLEAYARAIGPRAGLVVPVLDARKGEVYAAGYVWHSGEIVCTFPAGAFTPEQLLGRLDASSTLVGDGVDAHAARWRTADAVVLIPLSRRPPSGAMVAQLGAGCAPGALASLEPRYCRAAAAETRLDTRSAGVST